MGSIGISELLVIAGVLVLPCLGLLTAAAIVVLVIVLVRKNKTR